MMAGQFVGPCRLTAPTRDHEFESDFLQRGVLCEPDSLDQDGENLLDRYSLASSAIIRSPLITANASFRLKPTFVLFACSLRFVLPRHRRFLGAGSTFRRCRVFSDAPIPSRDEGGYCTCGAWVSNSVSGGAKTQSAQLD